MPRHLDPKCKACGIEKTPANTKFRNRKDGSKVLFSICANCQRVYKRLWKQKKGK